MHASTNPQHASRVPWNKGKLIGQKPPLKLAEIWTVRTRLQMAGNARDLALSLRAKESEAKARSRVRGEPCGPPLP